MAIEIRDEESLFERPLRRSTRNRMIAGVCGGLAEWLGWQVALVRLLFVALALVSSVLPVVLLYVLLAVVLPEERPPRVYLRWWDEVEHR